MTWLTTLQISIDNNAVERGLRSLAVEKRNSLLIGSTKTGMIAAILYTLVKENASG